MNIFWSLRRFFPLLPLSAMVAVFCYGFWVEPDTITVEQVVIADDRLWRAWGETTIVHLSDLHIVRPGKREKRLAEMVRKLAPDLIVITGDLAQWDSDPAPAIDYAAQFQARLGVFCVLGDSDMAAGRRHCLFCHPAGNVHAQRQHPVFLKDSARTIRLDAGGREMTIVGFSPDEESDPHGNHFPANLTDKGQAPLLVLHHFAWGWRDGAPEQPLLWLAGDTHGGQVRLPDFLWEKLHLADYPDYRAGLFSSGRHKWLYVNRGIGTSDLFRFRLGAPPEISVIRFVREKT